MAEYEKVTVRCRLSDNSDYSDPKYDTKHAEVTSTAATKIKTGEMLIPVASAMTLLAAGEWTTVSSLFVKNLDASNFVTVTYDDDAGTSQSINVLAGKVLVIQDIDAAVALEIQADTGAVECLVYVSGA